MNLKPLAGLAIFVLLFGIASHSLVISAFAQDAKAAKDKALADTKAAKEKAKTEAKDAKDKAKAESKGTGEKSATTGTAETTVVIAKGASTPGCDKTNSCFTPDTVNVSVGGKVTWRNDDTASHTATSGTDATADGIFDSSLFAAGKTFSFKFDKAGTYNYYCQVHPWMKGSVIVS